MNNLKTLKDVYVGGSKCSTHCGNMFCQPSAIRHELRAEAIKWLKVVRGLNREWDDSDKEMIPISKGESRARGVIREGKERLRFIEDTGVSYDDEYNTLDGEGFIMKFFNLSEADLIDCS